MHSLLQELFDAKRYNEILRTDFFYISDKIGDAIDADPQKWVDELQIAKQENEDELKKLTNYFHEARSDALTHKTIDSKARAWDAYWEYFYFRNFTDNVEESLEMAYTMRDGRK